MIKFLRDIQEESVGYPVIGNNSEQFSVGDAVYIDTDGFLAKATTSSKVLGYAIEDATMAADNETVAKKCPLYVYAEGMEIEIDSDQACTQTDIGAYADLGTVTSGVQVLNLAAGNTGQFFVLGFDANDTDKVVVTVAEPQKFGFAQS
jgi:hypothetical protein